MYGILGDYIRTKGMYWWELNPLLNVFMCYIWNEWNVLCMAYHYNCSKGQSSINRNMAIMLEFVGVILWYSYIYVRFHTYLYIYRLFNCQEGYLWKGNFLGHWYICAKWTSNGLELRWSLIQFVWHLWVAFFGHLSIEYLPNIFSEHKNT